MSNHLHLIARAEPPAKMSDIIRDLKKYTSRKIVRMIEESAESRKDWLLHKFNFEAKRTGRAENYKLWKDDNHAIMQDGNNGLFQQKTDYIHDNPIRQMIVNSPEDYIFSSAVDYCGGKGLVKVIVD